MRHIIYTLILIVVFPSSLCSLALRNQGEMSLGLIGGYEFPQAGYWRLNSRNRMINKKAYEYGMGLSYQVFLLDFLNLSTEILYSYNRIIINNNNTLYSWEGHFIDLSASVSYYWFEFLYLGGGLYGRFPYHKIISDLPGLTGKIHHTFGLLVEIGLDMKLSDYFALKIGIRQHLSLLGYHNMRQNNLVLRTFPVGFIFGFEWIMY